MNAKSLILCKVGVCWGPQSGSWVGPESWARPGLFQGLTLTTLNCNPDLGVFIPSVGHVA